MSLSSPKKTCVSPMIGAGNDSSEYYTEELILELVSKIFIGGVGLNDIMSYLSLEDCQNMQQVCRAFNALVMSHTPSWKMRQVVITDLTLFNNWRNGMIMIPRIWTSARVDGLSINNIPALNWIWPELTELRIRKRNEDFVIPTEFSRGILRRLLPICSQLKVLSVRAELLCGGNTEDLRRLETLWSNLNELELTNARSFAADDDQNDIKQESSYSCNFQGLLATTTFEYLSTLSWTNLKTLRMRLVDRATARLMSPNLLNTLQNLEICTARGRPFNSDNFVLSFWEDMPSIPNLKRLKVGIHYGVSAFMNEYGVSPVVLKQCTNFSSFLVRQPLLESLTILADSARIPTSLIDTIATRSSHLRKFSLECFELTPHSIVGKEDGEHASFTFLNTLNHLQVFSLKLCRMHDFVLEEITSNLPATVVHTNLDVRTVITKDTVIEFFCRFENGFVFY